MKLIVVLFALLSLVYSQCNTLSKCDACISNSSCVWCVGSSFSSCQDNTQTCSSFVYTSNITTGGSCPLTCDQAVNCQQCSNSTFAALGCVYCNYSSVAFQSCTTNSTCSAVGNAIAGTSCPAVCEAAKAPNASYTGATCNLPSGQMIPLQQGLLAICNQYALGYGAPEPTAANCSDNCTAQQAALPQSCLDAIGKLNCLALCPACDNNYGFSIYQDYAPCQSVCDAAESACNTFLTGSCKLNTTGVCSTKSTCSDYQASLSKNPSGSCAATSSSSGASTSSSSSSGGVSTSSSSSGGVSTSSSSSGGVSTSSSSSKSSGGVSTSSSSSKSSGVSSSSSGATTPAPTPSSTGFGLVLIAPIFTLLSALLF